MVLPREVLRWLQSLKLSRPVKNPRRDCANGYILAEMIRVYFPEEITIHNYVEGTSIEHKLSNWGLLQKVFKKLSLAVDEDLIQGTIHCKPNAAEPLLAQLYTALTHRKLPEQQLRAERLDDLTYQASLPPYARATAAYAIKNNLRPSEDMPSNDLNQSHAKIESIIESQQQLKQLERETNPDRYGISVPNLAGQRARLNQSRKLKSTLRRPAELGPIL